MQNDIFLRRTTIEDASIILDWENNAENWANKEVNGQYSILDVIQLIVDLEDVRTACQGRWLICDKSTNKVLGAVDLTDIDFNNSKAGVGILVASNSDRNKGIGAKALALIENEAITLNISSLDAYVLPNNLPSIKLFEKCNFEKIGKSDEAFLENGEYIHAIIYRKWLKK